MTVNDMRCFTRQHNDDFYFLADRPKDFAPADRKELTYCTVQTEYEINSRKPTLLLPTPPFVVTLSASTIYKKMSELVLICMTWWVIAQITRPYWRFVDPAFVAETADI